MAYTLPPIAVTGEIITAAWGNDVRNALAVLKTGLTADVGSFRATLNGTAAVDTGIARPALVNTNGRDEWGMVNFGDFIGARVFDAIFHFRNSKYTSIATTGSVRIPPTGTVALGNGARIFLGESATFNGFSVTVSNVVHSINQTLVADYWDGNSWESLTITEDTTQTGNSVSLTQDGSVTWDVPSDWAQNAVNGQTLYWVRLGFDSGWANTLNWDSVFALDSMGDGIGRDAEWPIIRLNDLHNTEICPAVSAGDVLDRSNSLVFADAVADGEDAYLAVLSNGNLAIAVGAAGVHALPFSIKTLSVNRLA